MVLPSALAPIQLSRSDSELTDVGPEQWNGTSVEHVRVQRTVSGNALGGPLIAQLSTVDYYLNSDTAVPVAMKYADHPNEDALTNIAIEVDFSSFQQVGNRIVPYQVTRLQGDTPQYQDQHFSVTIN